MAVLSTLWISAFRKKRKKAVPRPILSQSQEERDRLELAAPCDNDFFMDLFFFPHLAPNRATTHVALFLNVQNASHLKKHIISAAIMEGEAGEAAREQVNYAFIDARFVSPSLPSLPRNPI